MPESVKKLTGSSYPAEIWKNYMDQIHADLTPIDFLPYAQISDDYQDSQETQDTPADDQTQNNPTDQTVTTPDAGTTTPDKTTTNPNKTDAAGGNTGGNTGDNTDGTTGGNTGENNGGNTGGNGGQNTGGNTGGNTGETMVATQAEIPEKIMVATQVGIPGTTQVELPVVPPEAEPSRFSCSAVGSCVLCSIRTCHDRKQDDRCAHIFSDLQWFIPCCRGNYHNHSDINPTG